MLHWQLRQLIPALADSKAPPENLVKAKLQFSREMAILMPAGKPDYLCVNKFPSIRQLITDIGEPAVVLLVSSLIQDFCSTMNRARPMSAVQIAEVAFMLVFECGTFRLEDYAMMFAQAKRGELVKIYESIDMSVITAIRDAYDMASVKAVQAERQQEDDFYRGMGPSIRSSDGNNGEEVRLMDGFDGIAAGLGNLREKLKENGYGKAGGMDAGTV